MQPESHPSWLLPVFNHDIHILLWGMNQNEALHSSYLHCSTYVELFRITLQLHYRRNNYVMLKIGPCFLVNRVFVPCPKRGRFDENGDNNESACYPLKTRASLLRPLKTTKMTKMAGVTQAKAWFSKSRAWSSLIRKKRGVVRKPILQSPVTPHLAVLGLVSF